MKVLLISPFPPPTGGIASWTKRILEIGLPGNWEIVHVNSNMIGERDCTKTKFSVKVETVRNFRIWKNEISALKNEDISIVHICSPCFFTGMLREIVCAFIAKLFRKKVILHTRSTLPNLVSTSKSRFLFRRLAAFCDGIITLNSRSTEFAEKNSKSVIRQIPNFVSLDEAKSSPDRIYSDNIENVVYVGNVLPEKGCDIIVEAAAKLSNIRFHLVGPVAPEMEDWDYTDNVVLYGNQPRENIGGFLAEADVFLFPSRYFGEGFSNSLVEAMSTGLPCIVTDWAANADMIGQDGGVILSESTADCLKDAVLSLSDKETRKLMGERNKRVAQTEYIENKIIPRYVQFYDDLLKG